MVLPAAGWSEKDGTYTNLERRIQRLRKVTDSSFGKEDWKIISEVSQKMGYQMNYSTPKKIMEEISECSPLYRDLTYDVIDKGDCLWPYHGEPLRGEIKEVPEAKEESPEYNAESYLGVEQTLFHSGTLSRKSLALKKICPEPALKIGVEKAERLSIKEGDNVHVYTSRGSVSVPVTIDGSISDNKLLLSNHFENKGVFSLLSYNLDPVTKAPGIEGCEVVVKKA